MALLQQARDARARASDLTLLVFVLACLFACLLVCVCVCVCVGSRWRVSSRSSWHVRVAGVSGQRAADGPEPARGRIPHRPPTQKQPRRQITGTGMNSSSSSNIRKKQTTHTEQERNNTNTTTRHSLARIQNEQKISPALSSPDSLRLQQCAGLSSTLASRLESQIHRNTVLISHEFER